VEAPATAPAATAVPATAAVPTTAAAMPAVPEIGRAHV
jgi:hypothetical protein